jgi:hypothetical protein
MPQHRDVPGNRVRVGATRDLAGGQKRLSPAPSWPSSSVSVGSPSHGDHRFTAASSVPNRDGQHFAWPRCYFRLVAAFSGGVQLPRAPDELRRSQPRRFGRPLRQG